MPTPLPGGSRGDFRDRGPLGKFGLPSTDYPTPNVEDIGIVEERDFAVESYSRLIPGTPHPSIANAYLVFEKVDPPDAKQRKVRRVYRTDPTLAQEPYNAQTRFGEQASGYPCHIRRYLLRRPWTPLLPSAAGSLPVPLGRVVGLTLTASGSGYPQSGTTLTITATSPDTGTGAQGIVQIGAGGAVVAVQLTAGGSGYLLAAPTVAITGTGGSSATATAQIQTNLEYLVEEYAEPAPGENLSLFDIVTRIYRTLPGPIVSKIENLFGGYMKREDRQAVPTINPDGDVSVPPEAVGVILEGQVQQKSITEAEEITVTVANADGSTAAGLPIRQLPSVRDPETGVEIFEDIFTAVPGYQLPITYTPPAVQTASGLFNFASGSSSITIETLAPYDVSLTGWTATGYGMAANTVVTNQQSNLLWLNNPTTAPGTLAGLTFYPPVFSSYNQWMQPNNSLIGYSNTPYDPPRYPIFAEATPNEGSSNLTVRVRYCQIPLAMIRDESEGYEYPAIFLFNSNLSIPNNYAGQYRPPWPIGANETGGYSFLPHRQAVFPVRKITTYSLGETGAIPTVYRVLSPGAASKIFKIPPNCIHPQFAFAETFTVNGVNETQLVEKFNSSTPSYYDPNEIIVIKSEESRWRGNIWKQEVWYAGENVPPSSMPNPIANGYYKATHYPTATSPALVNFNALNAPLFAWTARGSTPNVSVFGSDVPTTVLGSLVETIAAVAASSTPNFTPDNFYAVKEIVLDSPVPAGDTCTVYAGFTPQIGSVNFTGLPNVLDTLAITNGEGVITGLSAAGQYSFDASVTSGSSTVTVASTTGLVIGMQVGDFNGVIPASSTIATIPSGTTFTLSTTPTTTNTSAPVYAAFFFTAQPTLTIYGGGGSRATGLIQGFQGTLSGSSVWITTGATLTSAGSGYTSAPSCFVSGSGAGVLAVTATQGDSSWEYQFGGGVGSALYSGVTLAAESPTNSLSQAERQQALYFANAVNGVGAPSNLPSTMVRASVSPTNGRVVNLYGLNLTDTGAADAATLSIAASGTVATVLCVMAQKVASVAVTTKGTGYTAQIYGPMYADTQNGGTAASFYGTFSGYVTAVAVTAGGYGYTNGASLTISGVSGGTGATGTIVASVGGSGGTGTATITAFQISSIAPNAAGSGYVPGTPSLGAYVLITNGTGTGAVYTVNVNGSGQVTGFNKVSGGSGYSGSVTVTVQTGVIQSATVTASGHGYNSGATATAPTGTGATFTVTTPIGLTSVSLNGSGTGYTSTPVIESAQYPSTGGTPAVATMALTTTHQVFQVALISAGTLVYSVAPTIAFSGGGFVPGTAAAATVNLNAAGIPSSVTLSNPGTNDGYASAPTGTISGGTSTGTTWAQINQFVPGQLGQVVAAIPAGASIAFRGESRSFPKTLSFNNPALSDGAPDAEVKATLNLPGAEVFYSDWLQFAAGEDITLTVIVAGSPAIRCSYELSSQIPASPLATTAVSGNSFTNGSMAVTGSAFNSPIFGCAVESIGDDPYENEIVNASTLLRPYRGTSGAQTALVYEGYPAYQIAAGQLVGGTNGSSGQALVADIGTPSGQFVRLKFQPVWQSGWSTPTPGAFTWRSVHAAVSWVVFPD